MDGDDPFGHCLNSLVFQKITTVNNGKKIGEWMKVSRASRPYFLMTNTKIIAYGKKIKAKKLQGNKENIIKKILEQKEKNKQGTNNDNHNDNEEDNKNDTEQLAPLVAILQYSFLRPQKKKSDRNTAKQGHENEEKFLKEFWELNKQSKLTLYGESTPIAMKAILRPGLEAKKECEETFVKDSADGVVVVDNNVSAHNWGRSLFFLYELTFFFLT